MRRVTARRRVAAGQDVDVLEHLGLTVGRQYARKDGADCVNQDHKKAKAGRQRHLAESFLSRLCANRPAQPAESICGND